MKKSDIMAKTAWKAVFLCGAIALVGWYVRYMHRSANPLPEQAQDYAIDLNLAPEVTEFEGFINYGQPIQTTGVNSLDQPTTVILSSKSISQPVFTTRKLKTQPPLLAPDIIQGGSKSYNGPVVRVPGHIDLWRVNADEPSIKLP